MPAWVIRTPAYESDKNKNGVLNVLFKSRTIKTALLALAACSASMSVYAGYVGESYLKVPGLQGLDVTESRETYPGWVKFEARDWMDNPKCPVNQPNPFICDGQLWRPLSSRLIFSAPWAHVDGPGKLAVALDKKSPALPGLMAICREGKPIDELTFAESSELSRRTGEVGSRPDSIPEYFEYKLTDVTLACPQVAGASEQALLLSFADIDWLNYQAQKEVSLTADPATLAPLLEGESRTYLFTWIEVAGGDTDNDCPELNVEPSADDYFALWPAGEVAQGRKELAEKGGLATLRADISLRGPQGINVCALPGVVADPGHALVSSQALVSNGASEAVASTADIGIPNQVYKVEGCVPGFRHGGNIPKVTNEMMRNGSVTLLLNISGIQDAKNDDEVLVSLLFSKDLMVKTANGADVQPDYTFRLSDNPEFTQFATQMKGRIENGEVITEVLDSMVFQDGGQNAFRLHEARMRVQLLADNKIKAVIGGYEDWRARLNNWGRNRILESTMRFQCPALYHAYKREADGLPDPVTGEFNGISINYVIDGVRAFIPEKQMLSLTQTAPVE